MRINCYLCQRPLPVGPCAVDVIGQIVLGPMIDMDLRRDTQAQVTLLPRHSSCGKKELDYCPFCGFVHAPLAECKGDAA